MPEEIRRRMRRFYRKGKEPKGWAAPSDDVGESIASQVQRKSGGREKDITMHLALEEVERFKEKHKRYPSKGEYDQIAESIYAQLRDKAERKKIMARIDRQKQKEAEKLLRRARGKRGKEKRLERPPDTGPPLPRESKVQKELKELSVEDLFAGEKAAGKKESEDEFSLAGLEEPKQEPLGKQCPNCKLAAEELIYCPNCGTAFCHSCAKGTETVGKKKRLTCPGCGTKVNA